MRPDSKRAMSPQEVGARDRRLARAIKSGVPVKQVARRFKIDHREALEIAASLGVTPPTPGRRNWLG